MYLYPKHDDLKEIDLKTMDTIDNSDHKLLHQMFFKKNDILEKRVKGYKNFEEEKKR